MALRLDEVIADPSDAQLGELREVVDLGRPLLKEMVKPWLIGSQPSTRVSPSPTGTSSSAPGQEM